MNVAETANEALRAHVTRVGFDLTLGKTHIAALVLLNESIKQRRYIPTRVQDLAFPTPIHVTNSVRNLSRCFAHFASGMHGCEDRGLILHHYRSDKRDGGLKWHYTITPAGKLVIGLLKEAGIYQEYADALPRVEAVA